MKILRYLKRLLPGVVEAEIKKAYDDGYTFACESQEARWRGAVSRELVSLQSKASDQIKNMIAASASRLDNGPVVSK